MLVKPYYHRIGTLRIIRHVLRSPLWSCKNYIAGIGIFYVGLCTNIFFILLGLHHVFPTMETEKCALA